jgi:hypothetical protein
MGLERDLHDLLYCHDLVIVPQWGGFLTHYRPARIDEARQVVHPPGKDLSFNKNLDRNDGLLADHLAKREGRPYKEAHQLMENAVRQWRHTLETRGRLELPHIGVFYRDAEKNLQFDPDRQVNYLKDAYGLRPVAAVPVEPSRETLIFDINSRTPTLEGDIGKGPARTIWAAAAAAAILFGAASLWAWRMGGTQDAQWSGLDPFGPRVHRTHVPFEGDMLPVARVERIVLPVEPLGVREIGLAPDASRSMKVDLGSPEPPPVAESVAVPVPAEKKKEERPAKKDRFHTIGGCFAQEENAERFLQELQEKGFQARRLPRFNDLHPVAFGSFSRREDALQELTRVKSSGTYSAWMMVR